MAAVYLGPPRPPRLRLLGPEMAGRCHGLLSPQTPPSRPWPGRVFKRVAEPMLLDFLPPQLKERTQPLGPGAPRAGDYVVYWMRAALRATRPISRSSWRTPDSRV